MSAVSPLVAVPDERRVDTPDAPALAAPKRLVMTPWVARLELRFASRPGLDAGLDTGPSAPTRTVLAMNRHQGPLLVQKALHPEGPGVCHAVLLHPPAGIASGDDLAIEVQVESGAHAVLSTPSATRWYKSTGVAAKQQLTMRVASGATLEWLPEENLFYEHVKARQKSVIDAEPGARLIAWDAFMLGRTARGEHWQDGEVSLESRLHQGGKLKFFERGIFRGGDLEMDGPAGLNGFRCGATLLAMGPGVSQTLSDEIADRLPYQPELMAGCSQIEPGLIMMRVLGREATSVRQLLHEIWTTIRPAVTGVAAKPLRLWAC
jgi:urease accessory protein